MVRRCGLHLARAVASEPNGRTAHSTTASATPCTAVVHHPLSRLKWSAKTLQLLIDSYLGSDEQSYVGILLVPDTDPKPVTALASIGWVRTVASQG